MNQNREAQPVEPQTGRQPGTAPPPEASPAGQAVTFAAAPQPPAPYGSSGVKPLPQKQDTPPPPEARRQAPRVTKSGRLRLMNGQVLRRALVVLLVSAVAMLVLGFGAGFLLDWSWRVTSLPIYQTLFYFFSTNRVTIIIIGSLVGLILGLGWVIRPAFNQYAPFIRSAIQIDGGPQPPVVLPKELKPLEDEFNRINRDVQLYKYAAKEAERRKDELVVYLAHDIRTPLTSVLGYLELLEESPDLPAPQREKYTGVALRKARRMQALVEELFEVTRFNMSQIELTRQSVQAEMLANQLAEEMQPELAESGVDVRVENRGLGQIFVDPEKMARAVDNILHNAMYYSESGGTVILTLDAPGGRTARIAISNTGVDIPQEALDRFFDKFYRGDEARQSRSGGSGLGLAIAKNIVEAHGGALTARNQNRVTTFEILLPM